MDNRLVRWAHVAAWAGLVAAGVLIYAADAGGDAHAYWAARGYSGLADERDAFLYTPVALQALWPAQWLPWDVFRGLFLVGQLAALAWLTGPIIALLVILPGPYSPVFTDLWFGNVMVYTAALAVAGFRHPAWWAVLPFGKVLPGVALLWSPRWIVLPLLIAAVSALVAPDLWIAWLGTMLASLDAPITDGMARWLMPRAVIAVALVLIGRWRGWRWTVPLAVMLAQPVLWYSSFTILLGWVWLLRNPTSAQASRAQVASRASSSVEAVGILIITSPR